MHGEEPGTGTDGFMFAACGVSAPPPPGSAGDLQRLERGASSAPRANDAAGGSQTLNPKPLTLNP